MNEMNMIRAETIVELSRSMMETIRSELKKHGDDPHLAAVLAAAYTMSIHEVDILAPGFTKLMSDMLKAEKDYE
jgi:hypothetical protein